MEFRICRWENKIEFEEKMGVVTRLKRGNLAVYEGTTKDMLHNLKNQRMKMLTEIFSTWNVRETPGD